MEEKIQYPQNLERAIEYVNQKWIFDEKSYPALSQLDGGKQLIFKFKHILLHMLKYSNFDVLKDNFRKKASVAVFDHEAQEHFFKLFISTAQFIWLLNIPITQFVYGNESDIQIEYDFF